MESLETQETQETIKDQPEGQPEGQPEAINAESPTESPITLEDLPIPYKVYSIVEALINGPCPTTIEDLLEKLPDMIEIKV